MEFWIFIGVVAALAIYAVVIYNNLVQYKNRGENAFSQLMCSLKGAMI